MKRILGIVLALCLVLTLCTDAFAASKPKFTKQPKTATTNKKGTVSFQVGTSGKGSLTWYFIDPEEPDKEYTGKTIKNKFKKLRVSNPNGRKITLGNVPEEMHGWTVYAHLNGNGYKVNSERVQLLVYGMEPPADGPIEGPEDDADSDDSSSKKKTDAEDSGETEPEEKSFTISCNEKALRKIDASGAAEEADPVSRIQFTSITSFEVKTEETFTSWTANGVRFEVEEPINGFKIQNLTTDLSLNLKIARPTEADAQRDESHMCAVKCVGCTFTSLQDNLRGATEGRVPAGTVIMVTADTAELRDAGYRINGDAPINMGLVSFRYTVNDDVEISTK